MSSSIRSSAAFRWTLALTFALLLPIAASAAQAPDPSYAALRGARPDGRTVPVSGLTLERDAYRFQFDSGTFHFLAPVEGRTVGAVFVGHGSYRLSPATESERRQLALSSGADRNGFETLTDDFDDLVLLFADDTAQEIELHAPARKGAPDPHALGVYERYFKRQRKDFQSNFQIRLLRDVLNNPGLTSGVFMALVEGKRYSPVLAAVDPDGAEALGIGFRLGGEDTVLFVADPNRGGLWYHCDQRAEVERKRKSPEKRLTDALDYTVDTVVAKDEDLSGTTTVRFKTLVPKLRVLPVHLVPTLRIQESSFALEVAGAEPSWKPIPFIQEEEKEDGDAAVVFPEPLAKGATVLLRLSYKGEKVLRDGGDKNYFVRARESWYPNLGVFSDPALFDLTYRVPAGNSIISVGKRIEEKTEGGQSVSRWKADHPVQVAGFNYGNFKKIDKVDETSQIDVEVYTNPGKPNIIREINAAFSGGGLDDVDPETGVALSSGDGPGLGNVNTSKLADASLSDGLNSARLFTAYFGPLPQSHVAITQQSDFTFGQSWPSLIFMPYISFLDGTQRQRLGMAGAKDFVDQVGYHEFAHQWWGHLVGAATYRDQWLEEGFSEFAASLVVHRTKGWPEYDRFWRERKKEILDKFPGNAMPAYEAGPITQGGRLSTARTPAAYRLLIYPKGGYVLHMVRMMMYDWSSKDPDARFIEMMKDYTTAFGGKFATSTDFQKVVERHMVPAMNATGDGKMDWFFNQWVYGAEVPRYTQDLKVESAGEETRIHGTVRQEGVSKDFRALVPLYVEFGKNETARIGMLPLIGEASIPVDVKLKLPKKARKAYVNAHGEVLARD
jgi:hypothetical protein